MNTHKDLTRAFEHRYRHWTQGNELLEGTAASYMMALRLENFSVPSHEVLTSRPQILRSRRALGCPLSSEQKDLYELTPSAGVRTTKVRLRSRMFEEMRSANSLASIRPRERKKTTTKSKYKVNELVVVRWSKSTKHDAKIMSVKKNGTYDLEWVVTGAVSYNVCGLSSILIEEQLSFILTHSNNNTGTLR